MYFPRGFEHGRAVELAELVQQAYRQLDAFKMDEVWKPDNGYSLVTELFYAQTARGRFLRGSTSFDYEIEGMPRAEARKGKGVPIGFVGRRGAVLYLVFRGTVTIEEWLRNLNITLSPYLLPAFGRVHDGFLRAYDFLRQSILEGLESQAPGKRLFIAGHSLGAALATLALPDISRKTPYKSPILYTYGSPRVGDKVFAEAFNRRHAGASFRIVNTSDIVVSIPLPVPFAGVLGGFFTHVDTPVDFTSQEETLERNHLMQTYIRALRESRPERGLLGSLFRQAP